MSTDLVEKKDGKMRKIGCLIGKVGTIRVSQLVQPEAVNSLLKLWKFKISDHFARPKVYIRYDTNLFWKEKKHILETGKASKDGYSNFCSLVVTWQKPLPSSPVALALTSLVSNSFPGAKLARRRRRRRRGKVFQFHPKVGPCTLSHLAGI